MTFNKFFLKFHILKHKHNKDEHKKRNQILFYKKNDENTFAMFSLKNLSVERRSKTAINNTMKTKQQP